MQRCCVGNCQTTFYFGSAAQKTKTSVPQRIIDLWLRKLMRDKLSASVHMKRTNCPTSNADMGRIQQSRHSHTHTNTHPTQLPQKYQIRQSPSKLNCQVSFVFSFCQTWQASFEPVGGGKSKSVFSALTQSAEWGGFHGNNNQRSKTPCSTPSP